MYETLKLKKEDQISIDILNRSFNGVILIDSTTHEIIYANEAIFNIFGYDIDQFIVSGISILSENLSESTITNHMEQVIMGHEINYISKVKHKDNHELYIDAKYFLINKNKQYICGLFKNITDKVTFAKDQNYKNSRLNRFLTTLHKISNSLEFQKGNVLASSRHITKLLSEAIDVDRVSIRLYNRDYTELESLSLYDKKLNQYLEGKKVLRSMYEEFFNYIENQPILMINDIDKDLIARKLVSDFFSKDGMIVSMLMTKIVLEGKIYGYIFFQSWNKMEWDRDAILFASQIADYIAILLLNKKLRKEQEMLEEKVQMRTRELEISIEKETQANLAKRRFLSHMSHELRTPLNAIIGYLELVNHSNDAEENNYYVERMKQGAQDLVSIVDDILDFSKIESGKIIVTKESINLKSSVLHVFNLYENRLSDEVKYSYMFDLSKEFYETDEKLLKQILHNLLSNAFKFTHTGSIDVSVSETPHQSVHFKNIVIEVHDTGIGIKEHDQSRIFESFEQSLTNNEMHHKGTGLGLSITKDLVKILGGSIEVESTFGKGSTFRVSIPMKFDNLSPITNENSVYDIELANFDSLHILIVEDNQINIDILKITLEKAKHVVDIAFNGYEALKMLDTAHYDIVLMDIHMPTLDGLDATSLIRFNPKISSLKIIALTANAFEFNEGNYLKLGFDGFLVKPLKQNTLLQTIYTVSKNPKRQEMYFEDSLSVLSYFEKYAKMNIKEGLDYTGNNQKLYFDLIFEFVQTHKETILHAHKSYQEKMFDEFYRDIHTLKGLSKLLGLSHIYQAILSLEEAYKDHLESYKIKERFNILIPIFDCTLYCIEYILNAFKERGISYGI